MYNFLSTSGSRFREVIGTDTYDTHWDDFLNVVSSSENTIVFTESEVTTAESLLQEYEANPSSGSAWFNELLNDYGGSFE